MFGSLSFKARILLGFGSVLLLMLGLGGFAYINNSQSEASLADIDKAYLPSALIASQMGTDVVEVQQFITDVAATHNSGGYEEAEKAAQSFKQGLAKFRELNHDDAEQINKLVALERDFDKFYADGKRMAGAYVSQGIEAGNKIMEEFDQSSISLSSRMNELRDAEVKDVTSHVHELSKTSNFMSKVMSIVSLFSVFMGFGIAYSLVRYLNIQLGIEPLLAKEIAKEIASGDFSRRIEVQATDKSSLLYALKDMQQQLSERIEREAKEKASALRIQMALDKAESNVMMADEDYNIIYVNEALLKMFREAQSDLRQEMPQFDVNKLLGTNIDIFHKNPAHQRSVLNAMRSTVNSSFVVGGRHMDFVANPVINPEGKRVGTVVEWRDRTFEIKIENEIKSIVEAVKAGELNSRLNTTDKTGFLQTLSTNINELTAVIEKVFHDIASVMQTMAQGDLSNRMNNDYEGVYDSCKNDINATLDKLSEVFTQIRESAGFISHSSDEIASGNNNLSQRAEQQAANLEETASSMEELTSTVKNNADNAQQANQVATRARELAEKGGNVVESAVHAMQEINESSNKIAAIIGVIDEIAFQTNLLALNASVEAARAGEHGRGFSVVATEVRNLAQRSANAARESKLLIQNSIQKVRNGTEFVNDTGKSLQEIVNGVKQVNSIIAQIASASGEQSAGIEQVNLAISQMDEITQQNAALAEQAAAASVSMTEQTTSMLSQLAFFHLGGGAAEAPKAIKRPQLKVVANKASAAGVDKDAGGGSTSVKAQNSSMAATASVSGDDSEWDEF